MITDRIPAYGDVRCIDCGIAAYKEAIRDMHNKQGKAYAAWLGTRGPQGRPRKNSPRR